MDELCLALEAALRPEAALWGPGQLTRRLQVVVPFHLSSRRNMGGCVSEDKTRLNRISSLCCSLYLGYNSWATSVYIKKKEKLVVPVVNCAAS